MGVSVNEPLLDGNEKKYLEQWPDELPLLYPASTLYIIPSFSDSVKLNKFHTQLRFAAPIFPPFGKIESMIL